MSLSNRQRQFLRALAHNQKPFVTVGREGLSESATIEIDDQLDRHELLKIKLPAIDPDARTNLVATICSVTQSCLVHIIGRTAAIYRPSSEPKLTLPT